jgi:hypothetical protein
MEDSVAQIVAEVAATADWMPPQIDRAARRQCLDQRGPDAFEKEYGCRLRSDVYQLWTCERHKRFEQKSQPWHDFRDTRLTASVVPAVLEFVSWTARTRVHSRSHRRYVTFSGESRRKKFLGYIGLGAPFVQNAACDFGVKYEDSGMYALEQVLTRESHKAVYLPFDIIDSKTPETHPWAFSPDGIGCDGTVAECKVRAADSSDSAHMSHLQPGSMAPRHRARKVQGELWMPGAIWHARDRRRRWQRPLRKILPIRVRSGWSRPWRAHTNAVTAGTSRRPTSLTIATS